MKGVYAILFLFLVSCGREATQVSIIKGDAFGTTFTIQYYDPSEVNEIEKGIDSVIYRVNKSVSTYMPNSDISKINRGDSTVVVDAIFKKVFSISEEVFINSNGYFDPTIGVLRNAYGFGDTKPLKQIENKQLDSLMQYVGFRKVKILADGRVAKEHPQIYFDFNAVAKGYGIDCIGNFLESKGIKNYLIELGGELLTRGMNIEKNKDWIVGVEAVASQLEDRQYKVAVKLKDKAMASSGNYRKYRIDSLSGKKYVHTLNPLTGSAEQSDVTSATAVANSCGRADAYATAMMALGLERSKELLTITDNLEAYLTYNDVSGNEQVFMTDGFKELVVD